MILVSGCLAGWNCRFKSDNKENEKIVQLIKEGKAILKEYSPSCGSNKIFDGTFSGIKIDGAGITARLLKENGIEVISEEQI